MGCIEEDPKRADVTNCGKNAARQKMTLNDISGVFRNLKGA